MRKLHPCFKCGIETRNKKYCSRTCAAQLIATYRKGSEKGLKRYHCRTCGKFLYEGYNVGHGVRVCISCNKNIVDWNKVTVKSLKNKLKNIYQFHARIRDLARRVFKRHSKNTSCIICGYDKHYEICHKKAISEFDEDSTIGEINDLSNLLPMCRNCHWEFDHGLIEFSSVEQLVSSLGP